MGIYRVDVLVNDGKTNATTEISIREMGIILVNGKQISPETLKRGVYKIFGHDCLNIGYKPELKTVMFKICEQVTCMFRWMGAIDRHHVNCLLFDKYYERQLSGLCGNADGFATNDYYAKNGQKLVLNEIEAINTHILGHCIEE